MNISKNAIIAGVVLLLIAGATTVAKKEVVKGTPTPFDPDHACDFFLQQTAKYCQARQNTDCQAWQDTADECKKNARHI